MKTKKITLDADYIFNLIPEEVRSNFTCFYFKDVEFDDNEIDIYAVVDEDSRDFDDEYFKYLEENYVSDEYEN